MMQQDFTSQFQARYLNCASYEDRGTILTIRRYQDAEELVTEIPFTTSFRRPGSFSYDWTDPTKGEFRVWSDQAVAYVSSPRAGVSKVSSLIAALKQAAGISCGGTMLVPIFLLVPREAEKFFQIRNMRILEREMVDKQDCNRIVGDDVAADDIELWISDEFLLRKLRRSMFMSIQQQKMLLDQARKVVPEVPALSELFAANEYSLTTQYEFCETRMVP